MAWYKRAAVAAERAARGEPPLDEDLDTIAEPAEDGDEEAAGGPSEIIWVGNEIIVRPRKAPRRAKGTAPLPSAAPAPASAEEQPTSNPLAPQSAAFSSFWRSRQATPAAEPPAEDVRNYGTEQDKAHCPFYIKTGACRFGASCSRIHMYPATSPTILIKGMYTGPGLPLPHAEEGLEYNDEDVAEAFAEFYNDVHSEFQCFGEIHNFKVSRNRSPHLRGNVYVHFLEEAAALAAFEAIHGRFFASKQVFCEFVPVTKWKAAICGEYLRSNRITCRRGDDCNFLHPFLNPGGEYDWADWERPPPRAWLEQMNGLFASTPRADRDKQSDKRRSDSHKAQRSGSRDAGDGRTRSHSGGARSPSAEAEAGKYRSSQGRRRSGAKRERDSPSLSTRSIGRDEKRNKSSRASRSKDRGDDVRLRGRAEDGEGARVGSEASRVSSRQRRARGSKACAESVDEEEGNGRWSDLDQYSGDLNYGGRRRSSNLITAQSYWDEY
eukprot:SM000002S05632  [mRNA]  locus=s2:1243422:1247061:- [translate_table: standard]